MSLPGTHTSNLQGKYEMRTTNPTDPEAGDRYFNTNTGWLMQYNGTTWVGSAYTSTSTSTTTTSTSTTTTSTSTTTTTSTSSSTTTTSTSTSL